MRVGLSKAFNFFAKQTALVNGDGATGASGASGATEATGANGATGQLNQLSLLGFSQ